jgi:hypothetical protein
MDKGHYVDGHQSELPAAGGSQPSTAGETAARKPTPPAAPRRRGKKLALQERLGHLWGEPPHRAPAPGPPPPKPWGLEEELRGAGNDLLKLVGFAVYDLEQGYRKDGSSRQTLGIGDCFIAGHGLTAWIEYKRWDNEPSPEQLAFADVVLSEGGIYLLVYELEQLVTWTQRRT